MGYNLGVKGGGMGKYVETTIKKLFALSGNNCAFPGCQLPIIESNGTPVGEICHIKAKSKGGPRFDSMQSEEERHSFSNLLLLCGTHHKVIDSLIDIYTVDVLKEMKAVHEDAAGRPEQKTDGLFVKILLNARDRVEVTNSSGNVAINSLGVVQVGSVIIKTSNNKVSIAPPEGTIGSVQSQTGYVTYLIKRYNDFASKDESRVTKFSFGALSKNIESQFGSSWKLLSSEAFEDVCRYIQGRIGKTRLAKLNASKGHPAFSTFEEFLDKHPSKKN